MIQQGDLITLDVAARSLHLHVPDEELAKRKQDWKQTKPVTDRGYVSLYVKHVEQSHLGADLDFLKGASGSEVLRDSH